MLPTFMYSLHTPNILIRSQNITHKKSLTKYNMNAANNAANNNNNQVNGIVVIHHIPAMDPSRGGWPPMVQFIIMAGHYRDVDKFWRDKTFNQNRWREAREANARANGVAVTPPDE
jgi:hypothetical protein